MFDHSLNVPQGPIVYMKPYQRPISVPLKQLYLQRYASIGYNIRNIHLYRENIIIYVNFIETIFLYHKTINIGGKYIKYLLIT